MDKKNHQRVLITGGTEGIGKGIASYFLKEGASVLITSRSAEKGEKAVCDLQKELPGKGNNIRFVVGDQSKEDGLDSVLKEAKDVMGGVDVLLYHVYSFCALCIISHFLLFMITKGSLFS